MAAAKGKLRGSVFGCRRNLHLTNEFIRQNELTSGSKRTASDFMSEFQQLDASLSAPVLRAGMVGMGMIFEETYAPFFRQGAVGFFHAAVGVCRVELVGAATRTAASTSFR